MSPTRREVLAGAPPARAADLRPGPPEQHLLEGVRVVTQEGVEVLVPPLHHEVLTARLDLGDRGYFREGTHMHLSHVAEDLEAWYINFSFDERVATAFRPNLSVRPGAQVVPQGQDKAEEGEAE